MPIADFRPRNTFSPAVVGLTTLNLPFLNVVDYNAADDGATDNTTAILAAVAALNAKGGGTLWFPFTTTGVYKVSSILAQTLFTFTNLNGIRLIGEGVTITDLTVYTGTQDANLIDFVNCKGIVVDGINWVAPIKPNYLTPHGLWFLNFKSGCARVRIDGSFTGGEAAVHPTKLWNDADTLKSTLFDVRIDCTSVERPITCEYSGDNSRYLIKCTSAEFRFLDEWVLRSPKVLMSRPSGTASML